MLRLEYVVDTAITLTGLLDMNTLAWAEFDAASAHTFSQKVQGPHFIIRSRISYPPVPGLVHVHSLSLGYTGFFLMLPNMHQTLPAHRNLSRLFSYGSVNV